MAKVDSGAKPLQNAMKMAKAAIQLDGGNRHKVITSTWIQGFPAEQASCHSRMHQ
uniref:Uncharacterized protein n=1 Tax=Neolamprologus brichardi TaxID=32507 RepID=A0A3Q4MXP7_NEOBR